MRMMILIEDSSDGKKFMAMRVYEGEWERREKENFKGFDPAPFELNIYGESEDEVFMAGLHEFEKARQSGDYIEYVNGGTNDHNVEDREA